MLMQTQIEDEWCWAAVAVSVDHYFNPASTKTQCQLAQAVLENEACCGNPDACDDPAKLQDALTNVNRLDRILLRPLQFSEIQDKLSANLPVCVRIGWANGGGHFVAIDGWFGSATNPQVNVADPLFDGGPWDYNEFVTAYMGNGQWTATFLVKP
jgi:Papain-like cysteine protease AvrRpt2